MGEKMVLQMRNKIQAEMCYLDWKKVRIQGGIQYLPEDDPLFSSHDIQKCSALMTFKNNIFKQVLIKKCKIIKITNLKVNSIVSQY